MSKTQLNLPPYDVRLKMEDDQEFIFCPNRKKWLVLTPEEWVRQHFINYLCTQNYPKTLINTEGGLKYGKRQKRSDILVYNRDIEPFLLVECKAPHIKIDQSVLKQIAEYNHIIKAPYIAVTNGLQHYYFQLIIEENRFQQLKSLPNYIS